MARPDSGLGAWLRGLPEAELARLLGRRPDVITARVPRSFAELADRLSTPYSVRAALEHADAPMLQVIEVLQALGDGAWIDELERTLGGPPGPALDRLVELGLVWPAGRRLRLAGPLRQFTESPLGLGSPVAELLPALTVDQLSAIGSSYGEHAPRRKAAWIELLTGVLTDADGVRARLSALPAEARELAIEVAWRGPYVHGSIAAVIAGTVRPVGPRDENMVLLVRRGWVLPVGWDAGQMPREVALAIRGPDYRPRLDATPPLVASVNVHSGQVEAGSRAAALAATEGMRRVLDLIGRSPLATVRAGGVGSRELAKAARSLGVKEIELRVWLEVLAGAGLVAIHRERAMPTRAADGWLAAEPADALVAVLRAWWKLDRLPSHYRDENGKALPALGFGTSRRAARLRADLLRLLADLGPDAAACELDQLTERLSWRRPMLYGEPPALRPLVEAAWIECRLFGVMAEQAITPLGRALLAGDEAGLRAVAANLLPAPATTATFLPDLTALVSGTPSAELAALLDAAADSETRDAASTWRFTPTSVRRAFDAGRTADELLTALAQVAERPLPQPLSYLVRDVARRHGRLRVTEVGCCVVADDPALAAEIASHRQLANLGLRVLGDTVLASAEPVEATLAALRAAGYAPVQQTAHGHTVVERPQVRRAPSPRPLPAIAAVPAADPAEAARQLRDTPAKAAQPTKVHRDLAPHAAQLSDAEQRLLAHAIERHQPVLIEYVSLTGSRTTRVIEPDLLLPPLLVAWCQLRDAERHFLLDRIAAVAPAG